MRFKSVFVNVFGGITACDAVAKGIVGALAELGSGANKPLVVRLDGNNVEELIEKGFRWLMPAPSQSFAALDKGLRAAGRK